MDSVSERDMVAVRREVVSPVGYHDAASATMIPSHRAEPPPPPSHHRAQPPPPSHQHHLDEHLATRPTPVTPLTPQHTVKGKHADSNRNRDRDRRERDRGEERGVEREKERGVAGGSRRPSKMLM
jgi:hypothetical protein